MTSSLPPHRLAAVAALALLPAAPLFASAAPAAAAPEQPPCSVSSSATPVAATVRITDLSHAALDHAAVELRCGETVVNGITDAHGELTVPLRPGRYTVIARAPGFADTARTASLPNATGPFELALPVGSATDVINVSADTGFVPFASNAGSKTNALLIEVPQSISIVNELEMQDRGVITVNEALRYTAGVQTEQYGVEPRFDWLLIRGFAAQTFGIYRDGMRFNSLAGKLDPYELESVEVLKGPSSVLYGEVPPGGLINQVTKRPSAERHTAVEGTFGSYSRRQGAFDTTGAFDSDGRLQYRLLGLIRNSGTQTNFTPDNRRLLAPSLTFHPSERTNLTILTDWQHDGTRWSQFVPAEGTLYNTNPNGLLPISTFLGEPGLEHSLRDQGSAAYTADHLFTDGWNVHSNYRFQFIDFDGSTFYGNGFDTTSANPTQLVARSAFTNKAVDRFNTTDNRALRRFGTGSHFEQTVLVGYDYQHLDDRETNGTGAATDINAYHPVYGLQTSFPAVSLYLYNATLLQQHGLYAQDQIKIHQHLVVTVGGRQDFARNDISNFLAGGTNFSHSDKRFTGRAGVTYLSGSGIAPYFAYSTSFIPNAGSFVVTGTGTSTVSTPATPSDARQIEGGVKVQPRTWNSFFTASVFQINETNVLVQDSAYNNHQDGEARSRGVELEGVSSLHHGINLHASYTHTATDTVSALQAPTTVGKWLPQVPRNQVAGLIDYGVPGGRFHNLGGNFGVRFTGANAADALNSFFVPNYALLDASLRFTYRHTDFQVNATNLADKRYVATCTGLNYCYFGDARNVLGTARYHF